MTGPRPPVLEPRDAATFLAAVRERIPAFVPGWRPSPDDPGEAVAAAFARFLETLAEHVNQAPEKNQLAFYDMLGASLLAAGPARAAVVFRPLPNLADSRVPAGTRVGAQDEDSPEPIVFETEEAIGLAAARLAEVVALWPGRDAYADHTADALRGRPFELFDRLLPVAHELYLAHDTLLALSGPSVVELQVELATPGEQPLAVVWEYWDGEVWRGFKDAVPAAAATDRDSLDGTAGLTRSGAIRLATDCAATERRRVHTAEAFWIRGRTTEPLPPAPGARHAEIERITLRTTIDRRLPAVACTALPETAGILPDHAFADDSKLDPTKAIEPLGPQPQLGDAFYLACDEIFSRPGAEVTLCFRKLVTPEERADEEGAKFEVDVAAVQDHILQSARDAADAVLEIVEAARHLAVALPIGLNDRIQDVIDTRDALAAEGMAGIAAVDVAVDALRALLIQSPFFGFLIDLETPPGLPWDFFLPLPIASDVIDSFTGFRDHNRARLQNAFEEMRDAAARARAVLESLKDLTPFGAALAAGATLPSIADPELAWEYWNGRRWQPLAVAGSPEARTLTGEGPVTFTVPDDMEPTDVAGETAAWIRARLAGGGYGIVRLVGWKDEGTGKMNFFPIVEYRPPNVDRVRFGYRYRSPRASPERCFAHNDFQFLDHTAAAGEPGAPFTPFAPVADASPALYLGFDGPLPGDALGFFFDVEEVPGEPAGPELVWEHWDGDWAPVRSRDATRGFTVPAMVRLLWPGSAPAVGADVASAAGPEIVLRQPADGARFAPGDRVHLESNGEGELAEIVAVDGPRLRLTGTLTRAYTSARVEIAALPRFGRPRTWVRARLAADAPPPRGAVRGVHPNAVWAAQTQTFEDEVLGSSSGEPDQVFFLRHTPVLGEVVIEVKELEGMRAEVEAPLLLRELEAAGLSEADVRRVHDPLDGRVREVWVRWRETPNLLFSRPNAREYVLERTRGRLLFGGDGRRGRIPPPGSDNILARRYRAGGGVRGNVAAGAIDQLLAGALVEGVSNPRPAEGGADGERALAFVGRGPALIRHRRQAIARGDYEDLARDASPGVAVARALPAVGPGGRRAPGWVTVQIVPWSEDPRPSPSFELRQAVGAFLAARAPAAVKGRILVASPSYFPVGVETVLSPARGDRAGEVVEAAQAALRRFLHPLYGGPGGRGWPFGRDVHQSDVAALLAGLHGVDYVERLHLLVSGTPTSSPVRVPADLVVAAGPIRVTLATGRDGAR